MYIIVGLGNPGTAYENTRHNVGFKVIDRLAQVHGIRLGLTSHSARWGQGTLAGEDVLLVKPMTYMNESGLAVRALLAKAGVETERLIVIYDDLDLEPGRLRIKADGGSGGHRGLRSIIGQIGDERFIRVRVGIGRPPGRQDASNYVLKPFGKHEQEETDYAIMRAADAVERVIASGVDHAMNEFNRKDDTEG